MKFPRILLCLLLSSCATKKEVHDLRAEVEQLKKAVYESSEPVETHEIEKNDGVNDHSKPIESK